MGDLPAMFVSASDELADFATDRASQSVLAEPIFEWEGERYKSLTAVTKAVTGKHWNGYHFFNLRKNGGER